MEYHIEITQDGITHWPLHRHPYWEIMYYIAGNGNLRTDSTAYPFRESSIIIVPPGIWHGSASDKPFKNISVGGDFENLFLADKPFVCTDNENGDGRHLAEMLLRNKNGNEPFIKALFSAYAFFLLERTEKKTEMEQAVAKIRHEITLHACDSEFCVTTLLCASGYSEDYLRAAFLKYTGLTPVAFVTKQRMEHALKLMNRYRGDIPCSRLCELCGYTDAAYFSRCFKKYTGKSPREFSRSSRLDSE